MKNIIELKNIVFEYDGEVVLDNVSLNIRDKEFVTLLGPSGCGKTTLLRTIGGFITPKSGQVVFDGKVINDEPPHKRQVNTVFQRYALFPHLNVFDNVAFGLKLQKVPKADIKRRVLKMLEIVNLKGFEKRNVSQLSGGQQQRVAIARALVNTPKVLLLDEPLGALDLKLRKEMQLELKKIQQQLEITFIYVTHDQEEALTMSDTVVVMKDGVIEQIGTPVDIYNEPKNAYVADFIGESNIFDAVMVEDYLVRIQGREFACVDKGFRKNQPVDVVFRPEDLDLVPCEGAKITGVVESVIFKGVHYETTVDCDGIKWLVHSTEFEPVGAQVGLNFGPEDIHIMDKLFPSDRNIIEGEVTAENTISYYDIEFMREDLQLEVGTKVELEIMPDAIEVVSFDHADLKAWLISMVYKGKYNEMIVYTPHGNLILHSDNDEQVATDIGIKIHHEKIKITPVAQGDEEDKL